MPGFLKEKIQDESYFLGRKLILHIFEEQRLLPNGNHVKNGIQQMLRRAKHLRTRSTPCFFLL